MSQADKRGGAALVSACWIASRLLVFVVILLTARAAEVSLADAVSRWDVQHFMQIAKEGYSNSENMAFFPGLPLLLRAVELLGIPMWLGGMLISLVASGLATAALYRMYGTIAACLWTLAPMTVFTVVAYTEAPFCAAGFWAWERARRGRWGQAGCLAALACSFRISGLFLIAGLGILALTQSAHEMTDDAVESKSLRERIFDAAWLLLPAAVILGYAGYLYTQTGSWLTWYSAQNAGWQRSISWPWEALEKTWPMTKDSYWPGRPEVAPMFRLEIVAAVIGYLTLIATLIRRRWGELTYTAANVFALTFSGWFISVNRGILVWFPLYDVLADVVERRPSEKSAGQLIRVFWIVLLAADIALLCWWTYTFARGGWAS